MKKKIDHIYYLFLCARWASFSVRYKKAKKSIEILKSSTIKPNKGFCGFCKFDRDTLTNEQANELIDAYRKGFVVSI